MLIILKRTEDEKDDELMVSGGNNTDYLCSIKEFTDDEIYLSIISANEADRELPCRIHLFRDCLKATRWNDNPEMR